MKALEGRIGIVTGGSSGIGYAISNVLAEAGATVYAVSRTGKVKDGMPASALGVIHVPVSYTHLDVYKRQVRTFFFHRERSLCGHTVGQFLLLLLIHRKIRHNIFAHIIQRLTVPDLSLIHI